MDEYPIEVPSNKVTNVLKVGSSRRKGRDPRFEDMCGKYRKKMFQQSYLFLVPRKKEEIQMMEEELLKDEVEHGRKERVQRWLQKEKSRMETAESKRKAEEILKKRESLESQLVSKGKKPFYLNKKSKKELLLRNKLISEGSEAVIEKKIKRRISKQSKLFSVGRKGVI